MAIDEAAQNRAQRKRQKLERQQVLRETDAYQAEAARDQYAADNQRTFTVAMAAPPGAHLVRLWKDDEELERIPVWAFGPNGEPLIFGADMGYRDAGLTDPWEVDVYEVHPPADGDCTHCEGALARLEKEWENREELQRLQSALDAADLKAAAG